MAYTVSLKVKRVLPCYEKYDKKFYPVSIDGLKGKNGYDWIINSLIEIPEDTVVVYADLYTYDGVLKLGNVRLKK